MDALIERAAGLDVHQGSVVACIILGAAGRRPIKEVRSFGTMRQDLAALREWLLEKDVTHVGMEGTGVYWQPVHAALEGDVTLIVDNASPMRNVPGREKAVKDAEWIADLVRHGLVRASFVPLPAIKVLREPPDLPDPAHPREFSGQPLLFGRGFFFWLLGAGR